MGWEELVAKKRKALAELIPEKWRIPADILPADSQHSVISYPETSSLLSDEELTITQLTVKELVEKIASRKYSAVQVCEAFCHRAAIAHQLVNCLVEIFFDAAVERAIELDDYLFKEGKTVGPLHGVPISLKDQFRVKGVECSMGYVAWLGNIDEEESVMTTLLRKAGAVLYVKTSVPQSVMCCETMNNIIGRTLNPYNRLLSCGGSSGGEAALIALHGSSIGIGTDIGGSIRTPAAFNGLWGIRPSHGRMPFAGIRSSMDGQETVHCVCGPIAHRAEDLAYFMKAILEQEPWHYDPKVIEIPWREEKYNEGRTGKKIFGITTVNGVMGFDGVVMPHPPILRGIQMVVNALRRAGHTVVEWQPYKHKYAVDLVRKIYRADGGEDIRNALTLSGEPAISEVAHDYGPGANEKIDLNTMWDIQIKKYKYQQEYMAIWMERNEINAWIQPEAPHAAIRHDQYKYNGYASVISLLDYPAVVVPVTFAQKETDIKDLNYKPISDLDMQVHDEYQADVYHGAPVAVQIIGRRLQEEYVIGLAEQ
ncbi:unnamed protein product, partial [Rotaria sp. Silwood2]